MLAFAVMLSSFVALTLVPMLGATFDPGQADDAETARHSLFARAYLGFMDHALKMPSLVIGAALAFAVVAAGMFTSLSSSLTPTEDRGFFFVVLRAPAGASSDYTDSQIRQVEAIAQSYQGEGGVDIVQSISGFGGSASGFVIVRLKDWSERDVTQQEILTRLNRELQRVPGVTGIARSGNSLGIRGAGRGVQLAVTGSDYETLAREAQKLVAAMSERPDVFSNPQIDYDTTQPLVEVHIDVAMAEELGSSRPMSRH